MDHAGRIERVRSALGTVQAEALLVTNLVNVRYLTGFSGTNGQVLIGSQGAHFLTDGRYAARATQLVHGAEVHIYRERMSESLVPLLQVEGVSRLGFEGGTVTVNGLAELQQRLEGIELVGTDGLVEGMRRRKETAEVDAIRSAVALGDATFDWILERLRPGRTERQIALDIEVRLRSEGAEGISFEPIVGSGHLAAHIHHTPSDRRVEKGDLVILDFGCKVDGYCSDLTRTVVMGPASDEQRTVYELVLEAHLAGIEAAAPDATGKAVDAAARRLIEDAGRGEEFGHGLGHGVGLDIHEAPRLARISGDTLEPGDVVTVEPGVYRPGWGGIRIEDCVLVTPEGREVLGRAPKDRLIEL